MLARHLWRQLRGIDLKVIDVVRIGIGTQSRWCFGAMGFEPCKGFFISLKQGSLGAQFGSVVAQGHAVVNFHGLYRRAHILNGAVVQAFRAEFTQHVQSHILGPYTGLQATFEGDAHRLRNTQPHFTRGHYCTDVSAFDAGAKRIESAIRHRVGVGAHNQITTGQVSAFGHHLVANAIANVIQHAAVFVCKFAHGRVALRRLQSGGW